MKRFEVSNGLNIVSIALSSIGSYFSFQQPLTAVWYDCRGSVGKYLGQLPYDEKYREEIRRNITGSLELDTHNLDELYVLLLPLFKLFQNGEYTLNFHRSKESEDKCGWYFEVNNPIHVDDGGRKLAEYRNWVKEQKEKGGGSGDIVDYTTPNFYEGNDWYFIATQPESQINKERVRYFENKISNGERPFVITLRSCFEDIVSAYYVLDGHHKLLAYQNLKVSPPVAEITHLPRNLMEVKFDIEKLIDALYPWQVEHIVNNWEDRDVFVMEALSNPDSKIHSFIKNGNHKEFYDNGQLRQEAFYINGRIEGVTKGWYENGQLAYRYLYKNHHFIDGEAWYEDGVQKSRTDNSIHFSEVFYEDGSLRSRSELQDETIHVTGWRKGGMIEYEVVTSKATYVMLLRKNYDLQGELINFEEFDPVEKKLVKRK
ncbi:hypothetical protein [Chitinophaga sp.]|uniref:toxin-antitoxin system YwqK family antitoxin n=1 Tax=Chitinophaga sp. TaxID=1869181 RepID=UPI0031D26935